jgi:bifunctional oligoribonuclease and PAP phosphatase NrnA
MTMNVPPELIEALSGARRVLLASHVPPDGDGLGSALAIIRALAPRGTEAVFAAGGEIQANLRFLFTGEEVDRTVEGPEGDFDLALSLDSATFARLGAIGKKCRRAGRFLNIDHHVGNEEFADLNWVDGASPATGEMVFRLLKAMEVPLTAEIATPLHVALVTDTGRFCYSNTTPAAHRMAADLLAAGADPVTCTDRIYRSLPESVLRLTGLTLKAMEVGADGLLAHVTVTPEMIAASGADPLSVGDMVDLPISLEGVEVAVLFRESLDGRGTKLSFRSRLWFPVNEFAARFGGGGHVRASGASLPEGLSEARDRVLPLLQAELLKGRP